MKILVQPVQGGTWECIFNQLPGEVDEGIFNLDCTWESHGKF